ncbi:MAG TPA: linear amide C-N hydrolase [Candidatus Scatosoma pullicola]|nr:linear amide C-N hydrolase [Candidatus Scatosoma pullicola]
MNHSQFFGNAREAGFRWGSALLSRGVHIGGGGGFALSDARRTFAAACRKSYREFFPEILAEAEGIAEGQKMAADNLACFLFSMYAFPVGARCTCIALEKDGERALGRNSDFLSSLADLYDSAHYVPDAGYAFVGNTTAFSEMEDGMNEKGLAAGLTFVCPRLRRPGFNAGMLVRYLLQKCASVREGLAALSSLPVASSQTIALADKDEIAVVECSPEKSVVLRPEEGFVLSVNDFSSPEMAAYKNPPDFDDWRASERYAFARSALRKAIKGGDRGEMIAKRLLSAPMLCDYRGIPDADTVWSSVYLPASQKIFRAEGNPSGTPFRPDTRLSVPGRDLTSANLRTP